MNSAPTTDHEILLYILSGAITIFVTLVWYLLRDKDRKQGEEITKLFAMVDKDKDELRHLELKIAQNHYQKGELDARFDKMEKTNQEEFGKLNGKMDVIIQTLMGKAHGG